LVAKQAEVMVGPTFAGRCRSLRGVDDTRRTFRFGGRDMRLTDVKGHVIKDLIA
jgi:hypothetical protein